MRGYFDRITSGKEVIDVTDKEKALEYAVELAATALSTGTGTGSAVTWQEETAAFIECVYGKIRELQNSED